MSEDKLSIKTKIFDIFRSIFLVKSLEELLRQFTAGKEFGTLVTKLPPNHYQYKKGVIRTIKVNDIYFELDISDLVEWYIYWGFEEASRNTLLSLIKQGFFVIDVGANVGAVTLSAAQRCGSSGRVLSFEIDSDNFKKLKRNCELNTFLNIQLVKKGCGSKAEDVYVEKVTENNAGKNRVCTAPTMQIKQGKNAEIIVLDDFIKTTDFKKVDLIKIDTEGYEVNVLKGAEKIIKLQKPILFIELDDNNLKHFNSSAKALVSYLYALGYIVTHAVDRKIIAEEGDFTHCHYDIVAVNK